ncbi:hypothetical protein PAXRUDRAFT_163153 [Paxillus rubicundulus Ve08.2h10]|uniref:Uncharacterized protein n=1 Tax=Paxillus rubicundulus Ve08.2h10 TaxID=930991 RepID=A0A0D0DDE8_9AGAM|nr:hypothetical protein PAXRUDRAFT_163153 [Paxillus rubicundulus Ve08.2h10]
MLDTINTGRSHRVGTTGNFQHAMRANYGEHEVDNYYRQVGATYRNPHFPGVRACMFTWLERWWAREKAVLEGRFPLIFDMACGTGEVTVTVYEWWTSGGSRTHSRPRRPSSLRVQGNDVRTQGLDVTPSRVLAQVPKDLLIMAADPYTEAAYMERTMLPCAPLSFREISEGALPLKVSSASSIDGGRGAGTPVGADPSAMCNIDMVVCSFALHLIESSSELFALLWELSTKARWLIVLAPHKRPEVHDFCHN